MGLYMTKIKINSMNMKDTVILLIFLLAVLGLIIGVHYTEDITHDDSDDGDLDSVSEDNGSVLTDYFEKKYNEYLTAFFS